MGMISWIKGILSKPLPSARGHVPPAAMPQPAPPMPACKPPRTEQVDRVQALSLAAGDTLIVTCDSHLTSEQIARIKAGALDCLPKGCKVMVLHGGLKVGGTVNASDPIAESIARLDAHNLT